MIVGTRRILGSRNVPQALIFLETLEAISVSLGVSHQRVQGDRDSHHEIDVKTPALVIVLAEASDHTDASRIQVY